MRVRKNVEKALQWAAQPEHSVLTLADVEYPRQLLEIADPPPCCTFRVSAKLLSISSACPWSEAETRRLRG